MAKKCDISGTGVMSGNNVSHANNKTRRRFLPNLQVVSLFSEALNKVFKLKVCSKPNHITSCLYCSNMFKLKQFY